MANAPTDSEGRLLVNIETRLAWWADFYVRVMRQVIGFSALVVSENRVDALVGCFCRFYARYAFRYRCGPRDRWHRLNALDLD